MIDVHMLLLPEHNVEWKEQALAALPSWINLFVVGAEIGAIGPQRLKAFRMGSAPYVSCIDPDDWTEPDAFDKCLAALQEHNYSGVCTREITHDFLQNKTYITRFKHKTFVIKREWMESREALYRYDIYDKDIVAHPDVVWLPFVGHHWRRYQSAGKKHREKLQTPPEAV